MKCWQMDQLRLVSHAASGESTFLNVLAEVNRLGFIYCSFGMKAPVPLVAPRVLWCSNYPAGWQERYEEERYIRCDPSVAHAIVSDAPIVWSDEFFAACPQMRAEARGFGLVHAIAQPRRDARGLVSLLSCVREDPPVSDEELRVKIQRVQWLSYLCHEGMARHWKPDLLSEPESGLSERELEVLRWSSNGNTSAEMAQILTVSEATVNFHMRNACTKLGTRNKTAAAVRAALMGLLW